MNNEIDWADWARARAIADSDSAPSAYVIYRNGNGESAQYVATSYCFLCD